jgi:hypothetical protein
MSPLGHRWPRAYLRGFVFGKLHDFLGKWIAPSISAAIAFSALSDTAPASVAKSVATPLASIRKHLQRFGFRSLVDGSDGEHYLAAALAHRRWVLDRQIGDRLHA